PQPEKKTLTDEQVEELIAKYDALPAKDRLGAEWARIVEQLKALGQDLPQKTREEAARLTAAHNLRQIGVAVRDFNARTIKVFQSPSDYGSPFYHLLPYIEQSNLYQSRPRWEYKVLSEVEILKLSKDGLSGGLNKMGEDGWELVSFDQAKYIF